MSVLLDADTRVLVQGITGQQARVHVEYMLDYGTQVVAGVSPRKGGQDVLGIPVFGSVREALAKHPADLSVLFVPGRQALAAALEAINTRIPHVHVLAESVPHHDTATILHRARLADVRVVGPNSQGMISPGKAKLGGTGGAEPDAMYRPGPVGILSRSGGMGGEIASVLSRRGIGQSTCVSIGGDLLIGQSFADLMPLYEDDEETELVVLFGEPGGAHEVEAADLLSSGRFTKPLVAFVCGEALESLPRSASFGHTSRLVAVGECSVSEKKKRLREAGAHVAERFDEIPEIVANVLGRSR